MENKTITINRIRGGIGKTKVDVINYICPERDVLVMPYGTPNKLSGKYITSLQGVDLDLNDAEFYGYYYDQGEFHEELTIEIEGKKFSFPIIYSGEEYYAPAEYEEGNRDLMVQCDGYWFSSELLFQPYELGISREGKIISDIHLTEKESEFTTSPELITWKNSETKESSLKKVSEDRWVKTFNDNGEEVFQGEYTNEEVETDMFDALHEIYLTKKSCNIW